MEQLKENIHTFSEDQPLTEKEMEALLGIAGEMLEKNILPCTACHYCVSHCPKGLNIPELLELYNEDRFTGGGFIAPMALMAVPDEKQPRLQKLRSGLPAADKNIRGHVRFCKEDG